jgi:membrane-bound lytic murein transglycosylase D
MSGIKPIVTTNIKDTKKEEKIVKENKQIKDNKKVKEIDKNKKNIDNKKDINEPIIYIVKKGDSFESIAKKHKINVKKLKADNKKKSNLIDVGDKIEINR